MSRPSMRRNYLVIPLVIAALTGCQDSVTNSAIGPRDLGTPRFNAFPGNNGKLAFAGVTSGIHTMNPDGTDVQELTPDAGGPAWSPDGSKMAFYSAADGNNDIYVVNADGTGRTQLTFTSAPAGVSFPAWSPDGTKIAFQNDLDGKIYVMNSDGSSIAAITTGVDFGPSWSPDGTKMAFTKVVSGQPEIYVMNADGTNQTRLTNDALQDYDPSWSPDGSKIVFSHDAADAAELYLINPDGTGLTNLTQSLNLSEVSAAWSPDGTKIAYIGETASGNSDVFVMNADGTNRTNLTNTPGLYEFHLDWQPQPAPVVCVFGPTVFTRAKGGPQKITQNFSATPGSYIVDLDDLGSTGADATVKLNGVVIMEGRGTTGEVGPRHHTVPVTLLANNVLEIELRGKKGSTLQVKVCSGSTSACYPNLAAPQLTLQSTTVASGRVEFQLDVPNHAQFPNAMFVPSPSLPACGINTSAARSWVDIYDGNNNYLYGFCSLYQASALNDIWFSTTVEQWPAEAYIVITDRQCNITYTSNRINLASIL